MCTPTYRYLMYLILASLAVKHFYKQLPQEQQIKYIVILTGVMCGVDYFKNKSAENFSGSQQFNPNKLEELRSLMYWIKQNLDEFVGTANSITNQSYLHNGIKNIARNCAKKANDNINIIVTTVQTDNPKVPKIDELVATKIELETVTRMIYMMVGTPSHLRGALEKMNGQLVTIQKSCDKARSIKDDPANYITVVAKTEVAKNNAYTGW